jgi:succinate dehydrogenase hydrophobic anchor subunit
MMIKSAPKRGFNFEYIMWLFTRLSALAMYALALAGLVGALIMGARSEMSMADLMRWTFMPNSSHVLNTNVPDIDVWATTFWRAMAIAFLLFAGSHGIHGLLNVEEDYLQNKTARIILRILGLLFFAVMAVIGISVILNT